jgi:hypothetical protein
VWRGLKTRSGLGWLSGYCTGNDPLAYLSIPEVETLRRRRLDVFNVFGFAHSSWDDLVASATKFGWAPPNNGPQLGQEGIWAILTIPTIVNGANYKDAAAGAYNGFHQQCAQAIKGWGLPSPIILRLGREPNDKGQPFSYFNDPSPGYQNYKDAHRHIVDVYAGVLGRQNIVFSWCVMKRAEDWENAYPGDDFTDVVDVDIYLNTPHVQSQQDWDQQFLPIVQPHIDFAAAHGKYFASSEWGVTVSGPNGDPANDSAVWMQNMWELWNRLHQRKMMAWECYYGPIGGSHDLTFQGNAPQASAAYARAWSGG